MAYNTQDERLLVKGNAHVKRQLKVDGDIYQETNKEAVLPNITSSSIALGDGVVRKIDSNATSGNVTYDATNQKFVSSPDLVLNGNLEANGVKSNGDLDVQGELIARNDLSVSGDLYVNGTEHINDTETAQTSDDYLVLRHNKTTALGANEHAGVAVHNYMPNKTATLTTDNTGTWRVADNTETSTTYTNISYYNGSYYSGLTDTAATVGAGIKSAWDEDELSECVFYNNTYYHFDGINYFSVALDANNALVLGAVVTDQNTIDALDAATHYDLVWFRSLTVTVINEVENEPILTRDEASNLSDGDVLAWDATAKKAVAASGVAKTTDITDAINALDVTDTAVAGQYISAVNEVDGKVVITRDTLPSASGVTGVKGSTESSYRTGNVNITAADVGAATSTDITNAINALDVSDTAVSGKYISRVTETNGKISVTRASIPVTGVKGGAESSYRTGNINITAANIGAATTTDITSAINALDVSDTAVSGQYVSAVSETDGKISVTRASLPTIPDEPAWYYVRTGADDSVVTFTTTKNVKMISFNVIVVVVYGQGHTKQTNIRQTLPFMLNRQQGFSAFVEGSNGIVADIMSVDASQSGNDYTVTFSLPSPSPGGSAVTEFYYFA